MIVADYLDFKMSSDKISVVMTEMELVKTIKALIDAYDHSPEIIQDILYYTNKLNDLIHVGVEEIEV